MGKQKTHSGSGRKHLHKHWEFLTLRTPRHQRPKLKQGFHVLGARQTFVFLVNDPLGTKFLMFLRLPLMLLRPILALLPHAPAVSSLSYTTFLRPILVLLLRPPAAPSISYTTTYPACGERNTNLPQLRHNIQKQKYIHDSERTPFPLDTHGSTTRGE